MVTLDTVKKHVSHVLGKLGAANRTEAVTRGAGARADPLTAARCRQVPPDGPVTPPREAGSAPGGAEEE